MKQFIEIVIGKIKKWKKFLNLINRMYPFYKSFEGSEYNNILYITVLIEESVHIYKKLYLYCSYLA